MTLIKIEYGDEDTWDPQDPMRFRIFPVKRTRWAVTVVRRDGDVVVVGEYKTVERATKAVFEYLKKVGEVVEVTK